MLRSNTDNIFYIRKDVVAYLLDQNNVFSEYDSVCDEIGQKNYT